ncbi:MAG: hypothetical protein O7C98_03055 [Planctomycetota bacterium]|nr:hypothetical protein [Planctomycetota bacterium]
MARTASAAARAAVLLGLLAVCSCVYLRDRGMDFLDQWRVGVGAGSVIGVRYKALGLIDTGLMVGIKPNASALGWVYGAPFYFNKTDPRFMADQAELIKTTSIVGLNYGTGAYRSATTSFFLLPAVFTWADSTPLDYEWQVPETGEDFKDRTWLWSGHNLRENRYAQIHAFDIEAGIGLGVYLDAGWSPGEALDFLLGILTIDLAKDDGRLGVKKP